MIAEFKTRKMGEIDIVEISGRLNLGNTLQSIETSILKMIEQGSRRMAINLAALDSIDSAGIGMLIACSAQMEQKEGELRVAGAHGVVARIFETVHLGRVAALDADLDTACRNLARNGAQSP
jgi:anti-sigma B factor antagonist